MKLVIHTNTSRDKYRNLRYLSKEIPGKLFLQSSFLSNEIKEIFAGFRTFHHDYEGVVALKVVKEPGKNEMNLTYKKY